MGTHSVEAIDRDGTGCWSNKRNEDTKFSCINVEKKNLFCLLNTRPAADEQRSLFMLLFYLLETKAFLHGFFMPRI